MDNRNDLQNATPDELREIIASMRADADVMRRKIDMLSQDAMGTLSRGALDVLLADGLDLTGKALVVFDIDNLKGFNSLHGINTSNDLLRSALIQFRASDIYSVFSGDEKVLIVPIADAEPTAWRIQDALHAVGSSATFAIAVIGGSTSVQEQIKQAMAAVQAQKAIRKDCIVWADSAYAVAA
jgi:GGDEF domain-containing protein